MVGTWINFNRYRQLFYRILIGPWLLAVLVLVNAYSSLLISYLTIPTLMPVAQNYDDVAYRRVQNWEAISERVGINSNIMVIDIYIYCSTKDYDFSQCVILQNATDTDYKDSKFFKRSQAFAAYYRRHPERLFTILQQRFDLMFTGKFVYAQV